MTYCRPVEAVIVDADAIVYRKGFAASTHAWPLPTMLEAVRKTIVDLETNPKFKADRFSLHFTGKGGTL